MNSTMSWGIINKYSVGIVLTLLFIAGELAFTTFYNEFS